MPEMFQRMDWNLAFSHCTMNRRLKIGIALISLILAVAVFADFIAPYPIEEQDREHSLAPPTRLRMIGADGAWSLRPFVYATSLADRDQMIYIEDRTTQFPVRFFTTGEPYFFLGLIPLKTRLIGVDAPARVFLLGSDGLGRDVFSRLIQGTRLSLFIAVFALLLSIPLGLTVGCCAGYFGGKTDFFSMRVVELFLAFPALYLVIALRSALPLSMPTEYLALALVGVLALFGWAGLARVVRGMALSLRQRDYVLAAIATGASHWRVMTRHLLPHLFGFVLVQAALSAPALILAEVTLSYLGLGIQEPSASWGSMLAGTKTLNQVLSYWWNLTPTIAILLVSLICYLLAQGLKEWSDPKRRLLATASEVA